MILLSFFFLLCMIESVKPVIIGSNTAVSSQGLISFPNTDTNNTIIGYAYMGNGFALQDNTTSCTFNSFMPISGPLNLNGGRLILQEDLLCTNPANFQIDNLKLDATNSNVSREIGRAHV